MVSRRHIYDDTASPSGFTLVELLVAITIFTTVLAGVTLMFNSAVRVSKQGYQNQEAYSMARGVANRIEADLTSAYAALEHGLADTFYGSPIGFTFIGKVKTGDGPDDYDLARISYVIYLGPNASDRDPPLNEKDMTKFDLEATLTETEYNNEFNTGQGDGRRHTYSLIRYVEPDVDNLDTFDVRWDLIETSEGYNLRDYIGSAKEKTIFAPNGYNTAFDTSLVGQYLARGICSAGDFNCAEAIEKAAKRQFWLRMLAGGDSLIRYDYLRENGMNPEDYVIAEDILHIARRENYTPNDRETILYVTDHVPYNYFNDSRVSFIADNHIAPIIYSDGQYQAYVNYARNNGLPRPYSSTNYFFAYRATGTRDRIYEAELDNKYGGRAVAKGLLGGTISAWQSDDPYDNELPPLNDYTLYEQEVQGYDFAYWNDSRNLISNRITGFSNGTPTEGRLPEAIISELTIFLPTVYPGAPDFQRTFLQQIDAPAGHIRALPTSRQEAVRSLDQQTVEIWNEN